MAFGPDGSGRGLAHNQPMRDEMFRRLTLLLALSTGTLSPAMAQGTECEDLWYRRNTIYRDAGYCFKTQRAQSQFGNAGCSYMAERDVPLSARQRDEISFVVRREKALSCGQVANAPAPRYIAPAPRGNLVRRTIAGEVSMGNGAGFVTGEGGQEYYFQTGGRGSRQRTEGLEILVLGCEVNSNGEVRPCFVEALVRGRDIMRFLSARPDE
jgi:hypothetical protein